MVRESRLWAVSVLVASCLAAALCAFQGFAGKIYPAVIMPGGTGGQKSRLA